MTNMLATHVCIPSATGPYPCVTRDADRLALQTRVLAEETPVAFVYGGTTEAVMMATPADLEDLAVGFSHNEGLIEDYKDIIEFAAFHGESGIELRMWLRAGLEERYRRRRRRLAGPTGCGLCGIESLAEAIRPCSTVDGAAGFPEAAIAEAIDALTRRQGLNHQTRATHAAAFFVRGGDLIIREDVGRHNALDKLAGALCRQKTEVAGGAIVITSRVSVEMVQKAARIGAPILIAMSAPTALAVRTAQAAKITLIAVARYNSYQLFSQETPIER
jgi:FdhD protein